MEKTLYGGEVNVVFNPDSRFRYIITDPVMGLKDARVRGVTTILGDILDKPGLRLWARDEMAKVIFGKDAPTYHEKSAMLKSATTYSPKMIQTVIDESFDAYKSKSDRGKDIGTMTHDFVAQYLNDGTVPVAEDVLEVYPEAPDEFVGCVIKSVGGFIKWWSSLEDKELLGTENIIYSRKYQFSGTYDIKCRINGKVYMLDIKTTNRSPYAPLGVYPEYFMQLGGYMQADSESSKQVYDDCGVVNVGKDGKLSIVTASDIGLSTQECINRFIEGVNIHNWLQKTSKLTQDSKIKSVLDTQKDES